MGIGTTFSWHFVLDTGTIFTWLFAVIVIRLVIGSFIKSWYRHKEGTGHEVNLGTIGHRPPISGGDFEPDTLEHIERLAKEQAEREHPES